MNTYVLSAKLKKRYENQNKPVVCCRCGREIELGQEIIAKNSKKRTKQKFYHKKCFEEMLM